MTNERISFVVIDERNVRASCDRHSYLRSFQRREKLRSSGSLQGWQAQHSSWKEQSNWPKPWSLNIVNRASFLSPNYRLSCRFTVSVTSFYELPALHFLDFTIHFNFSWHILFLLALTNCESLEARRKPINLHNNNVEDVILDYFHVFVFRLLDKQLRRSPIFTLRIYERHFYYCWIIDDANQRKESQERIFSF